MPGYCVSVTRQTCAGVGLNKMDRSGESRSWLLVSLRKGPERLLREMSGNLSTLFLDFKRFSNLVLIMHNRLEIGSCFLDQMQFSLQDILIENGLFRVAKEAGGKSYTDIMLQIFFQLRKYSNP